MIRQQGDEKRIKIHEGQFSSNKTIRLWRRTLFFDIAIDEKTGAISINTDGQCGWRSNSLWNGYGVFLEDGKPKDSGYYKDNHYVGDEKQDDS